MPVRGAEQRAAFESKCFETRAKESLTLLRGSLRSVEAVAIELGYADARSFRRFIKGATGMTPEDLRARRSVDLASAS